MITTRRPITPRATLDTLFGQFAMSMKGLLGNRGLDPEITSMLEDKLNDLRVFAVSTADAAPAIDPPIVMQMVQANDQEGLERFVRRHLDKQIPLLCIEGADPKMLTNEVMEGLRGFSDLGDIARKVIAAFPDVVAPESCAESLETVMREAIGLDGRTPDPDRNPDFAAWTAMSVRMALQGDTPCPHREPEPRERIEEADLDMALTALCLPDDQSGGMRDEIYHVAMHNVARDTLARIEAVAGGPLDPKVSQVIEEVIRRAGDSAGPKIEVSCPDSPEI